MGCQVKRSQRHSKCRMRILPNASRVGWPWPRSDSGVYKLWLTQRGLVNDRTQRITWLASPSERTLCKPICPFCCLSRLKRRTGPSEYKTKRGVTQPVLGFQCGLVLGFHQHDHALTRILKRILERENNHNNPNAQGKLVIIVNNSLLEVPFDLPMVKKTLPLILKSNPQRSAYLLM